MSETDERERGDGPEDAEGSPASSSDGPSRGDENEDAATPREDAEDASTAPPEDDDGDIEIVGFEAADIAGVVIPDVDDELDVVELDVDLGEEEAGEVDADVEPEVESVADGETIAQLDAERAHVVELKEKLLRAAADFDNYRRRTEKARADERRQAAARLVKDLLPVLDNLQRALEQARADAVEDERHHRFVEGLDMIEQQLFGILREAGLEPIDASGTFDPNVHEAMMQVPNPDAPHLSILTVFESGYLFHGRLLRPARVQVAVNPEPPAGGGPDEGAAAEGSETAEDAADARAESVDEAPGPRDEGDDDASSASDD